VAYHGAAAQLPLPRVASVERISISSSAAFRNSSKRQDLGRANFSPIPLAQPAAPRSAAPGGNRLRTGVLPWRSCEEKNIHAGARQRVAGCRYARRFCRRAPQNLLRRSTIDGRPMRALARACGKRKRLRLSEGAAYAPALQWPRPCGAGPGRSDPRHIAPPRHVIATTVEFGCVSGGRAGSGQSAESPCCFLSRLTAETRARLSEIKWRGKKRIVIVSEIPR